MAFSPSGGYTPSNITVSAGDPNTPLQVPLQTLNPPTLTQQGLETIPCLLAPLNRGGQAEMKRCLTTVTNEQLYRNQLQPQ